MSRQRRWFQKFSKIACPAAFVALGMGCTSQQVAEVDAVAYRVLDGVDQGINWAEANPVTVQVILDDAATKTTNPTVLSMIAKAKTAAQSGDLATAQAIVRGGKAYVGPVTPGAVPTPSSSGQ